MIQFLIFLLLFGFIVLVGILLSVFGFFRMLFKGQRQFDQNNGQKGWPGSAYQQRTTRQGSDDRHKPDFQKPDSTNVGKKISDYEGEYVDYEEIK
jgi:hypothetical protein